MVDRPFEISFDELMAMPQVAEAVTLSCVSNEVGGDLVGNALWQGVPLRQLLDRAGVQPGATQIVGRSVDGFTVGFPTAALDDGRTALVAVGMNGEPLPKLHGFPARLVVAGLYGYVSATKWLREIHLTTLEDFDAYWVPRGWAKEAPIKVQSRIDVPRSGASLARRVHADRRRGLGPGSGARASPRWRCRSTTGPGRRPRWARSCPTTPGASGCCRGRRRRAATSCGCGPPTAPGETQTDQHAPPEPDGATGWHTRKVRVGS